MTAFINIFTRIEYIFDDRNSTSFLYIIYISSCPEMRRSLSLYNTKIIVICDSINAYVVTVISNKKTTLFVAIT